MLDKPTEIDMSNLADVAWVKSQKDPALWHHAAIAVIAYCHDDHGFLQWLIKQREMDRATAGWLLLWPEGSLYLRGQTSHFGLLDYTSESEMVQILNTLCERSETTGFDQDQIGLDAEVETERQRCLSVVTRGEVANGIIAPTNVISRRFAPPSYLKYDVEEGGLVRI